MGQNKTIWWHVMKLFDHQQPQSTVLNIPQSITLRPSGWLKHRNFEELVTKLGISYNNTILQTWLIDFSLFRIAQVCYVWPYSLTTGSSTPGLGFLKDILRSGKNKWFCACTFHFFVIFCEMVQSCAVAFCKNNSDKQPDLSFYMTPKDAKRRQTK